MLDINFAGTEVFNYPHIVRILKAHGSGHIGSRIGAVGADHGDDFGVEGFGH